MEARHTAGQWTIERDAKMFFRVVRATSEGPEFVRQASGKVSSFKTWQGARRALRWAEGKATGAATAAALTTNPQAT